MKKLILKFTAFIIVLIFFASCEKDQLSTSDTLDLTSDNVANQLKVGNIPVAVGDLAIIEFLSSEYTPEGNTEFKYEITSGEKPSLGHWDLNILSPETDEETIEINILSCSESYSYGKDGSLKKYDPELALLDLLKFSNGYEKNESREVSFVIEGEWQEGEVQILAKGGKTWVESVITGPAIVDEPNDPNTYGTMDYKGRTYKTVLINGKWWMAENLAYLSMVSPSSGHVPYDAIPTHLDYDDEYCYVYGYEGSDVDEAMSTDNYSQYGVLYNRAAAVAYHPDGWHLPSRAELESLTGLWGDLSGYHLRSTSGWSNINGDNLSGMNIFPSGKLTWNYYSLPRTSYVGLGSNAFLWTTDETTDDDDNQIAPYEGYLFGISKEFYTRGDVAKIRTSHHLRLHGLSVRLVKDE